MHALWTDDVGNLLCQDCNLFWIQGEYRIDEASHTVTGPNGEVIDYACLV